MPAPFDIPVAPTPRLQGVPSLISPIVTSPVPYPNVLPYQRFVDLAGAASQGVKLGQAIMGLPAEAQHLAAQKSLAEIAKVDAQQHQQQLKDIMAGKQPVPVTNEKGVVTGYRQPTQEDITNQMFRARMNYPMTYGPQGGALDYPTMMYRQWTMGGGAPYGTSGGLGVTYPAGTGSAAAPPPVTYDSATRVVTPATAADKQNPPTGAALPQNAATQEVTSADQAKHAQVIGGGGQ